MAAFRKAVRIFGGLPPCHFAFDVRKFGRAAALNLFVKEPFGGSVLCF
jgi:hypothetical protein